MNFFCIVIAVVSAFVFDYACSETQNYSPYELSPSDTKNSSSINTQTYGGYTAPAVKAARVGYGAPIAIKPGYDPGIGGLGLYGLGGVGVAGIGGGYGGGYGFSSAAPAYEARAPAYGVPPMGYGMAPYGDNLGLGLDGLGGGLGAIGGIDSVGIGSLGGYDAPAYGAPAYGAPAYGAPAYGAPAYGANVANGLPINDASGAFALGYGLARGLISARLARGLISARLARGLISARLASATNGGANGGYGGSPYGNTAY